MCMYYVGIDASLTGTAVVVLQDDKRVLTITKQELTSTKPKDIIEDRFNQILFKTVFITGMGDRVGAIYIEGLSFGSSGQSMLELAALHYMIRMQMYNTDTKYNVIPPTQLKKFVTGKGQSKKNLMLLQIYKKWGEEFSDDNIGDAYALARMAYEENKNENPV